MSRWWRAYDEAVDDPKLILLSDKAHRAWFNLMCVASENGGILPEIKVVAVKLRVSAQRAASAITELVSAGLIDKRDDGGFEPHNWRNRQFTSDRDPTAADRKRRERDKKRDSHEHVTRDITHVSRPPETETETETDKNSEPAGSGAEAPPDPTDPERDLFKRGKQVLGKSAGGQITKLLRVAGNVALARSKIELAATKQDPQEFIAKVIAHAGAGPPGKPLTQHQIERQTTRSILDELDQYAGGGGSSQADFGLLRYDPGGGPESVHGGVCGDVVDVSIPGHRKGG